MRRPAAAASALVLALGLWLAAVPLSASAETPPNETVPPETVPPETPPDETATPERIPLPEPDLSGLEEGVEERLNTARDALLSAVAEPGTEPRERGRLYGHTGQVFHAHHVFPVAEACYRNAAALDPEEPLWPYLLGFIYDDTVRLDEAAKSYRRVLELDGDHPLATLRLARVLLQQGEVESAEELLGRLDSTAELAGPIHAALGKVATTRKDHAAAARHYEAALAAQPQASQLHHPLALAYRHLGEIEKAREHAALGGTAKLVVADPFLEELGTLSVSSQMFLTTGAQALKAERFDLAEKAFRGAIAVNPENKRAHLNLAVVLAQGGDLDAAEKSAREALRIDPEYGFAYFNLGTFSESRGQLSEAMGYYEKALARNPEDLKANFRLANALMRTGDYERAARHYRKAIEISPSLVRARYLESLALIALRRYPEARKALAEAVEIHPENVEFRRSLARLLATSGEPDDGARALALASALARDSAENVETLAMALAATGRFAEAVAAQQALVEALRGKADPKALRQLEYNLERYRRGEPSDRPWSVENE